MQGKVHVVQRCNGLRQQENPFSDGKNPRQGLRLQNGAAFIFACYGAGCGGFSVTAISCRCVKKKEEWCSSSLPVVADWL